MRVITKNGLRIVLAMEGVFFLIAMVVSLIRWDWDAFGSSILRVVVLGMLSFYAWRGRTWCVYLWGICEFGTAIALILFMGPLNPKNAISTTNLILIGFSVIYFSTAGVLLLKSVKSNSLIGRQGSK